jgi:hypothetical protein
MNADRREAVLVGVGEGGEGVIAGDDFADGEAPGLVVEDTAEGGGDEKVAVDEVAGGWVTHAVGHAPAHDFTGTRLGKVFSMKLVTPRPTPVESQTM